MSALNLAGVFTALVTPFKNGSIDFSSYKKLMRHQLDGGIQGFVVSGSTGEAATLSSEEKVKLLNFTLSEVAGAVPVIMGSGTFNTQETCELIKLFEKSKPAGFLIVTPYYNKPPQRGLEEHFLKTAQSTRLPIILYNVPGRTACILAVETTVNLALKASNIIGIKEAAGDLTVISELSKKCPKGFQITSGDDPTFLEAIVQGAVGVISVVSHLIPKKCVDYAKIVARDSHQSKGLTSEIKDISEKIFCESNPIPVKWALREMGILESDEVRLPLVNLKNEFHEPLRGAMKKAGAL
jgi:4-hydroxy-tetrahydrodipicolinate synthase